LGLEVYLYIWERNRTENLNNHIFSVKKFATENCNLLSQTFLTNDTAERNNVDKLRRLSTDLRSRVLCVRCN